MIALEFPCYLLGVYARRSSACAINAFLCAFKKMLCACSVFTYLHIVYSYVSYIQSCFRLHNHILMCTSAPALQKHSTYKTYKIHSVTEITFKILKKCLRTYAFICKYSLIPLVSVRVLTVLISFVQILPF